MYKKNCDKANNMYFKGGTPSFTFTTTINTSDKMKQSNIPRTCPNTMYKASDKHIEKINMINTDSPYFNVSKRDIYFINKAIEVSAKSNMMMKHGCVITCNNKFMSDGYNSYRTQFGDNFIKQSCSCHAEMHALRNALKYKTKGCGKKYLEKGGIYEDKPS